MKKQKRLDGKKKLVLFSAKMENDMRLFCRSRGIKSESELVREAVASYIYADYDNQSLKTKNANDLCRTMKKLQNTLDRVFRTN